MDKMIFIMAKQIPLSKGQFALVDDEDFERLAVYRWNAYRGDSAVLNFPREEYPMSPLKRGTSKATVSSNIKEFHTGKTYAKTAAKFGKEKADKQAVAAAFAQKRRSK